MSKRAVKTKAAGPGPDFLAKRRRQTACVILLLVSLAVVIGVVQMYRTFSSPESVFLVASGGGGGDASGGAKWIVEDRPANIHGQQLKAQSRAFRRLIAITAAPARAVLSVRGFRALSATIDGQSVLRPTAEASGWRQWKEIDLTSRLTPGEHVLVITVTNDRGPPALQAGCDALSLVTDERWEVSADQIDWKPARPADVPYRPELADQFPSVFRSILVTMPVWLSVMIIAAGAILFIRGNSRLGSSLVRFAQPARARWALMAAWAALGINNIFRVPSYIAFDAVEHMQYIEYVAKNWRIPLASEGWQMFQSPLYYMVCAPVYAVVQNWFGIDGRAMTVRIVPLLCGLGMIEILRRAMRRAFPDRADLQSLGLVLGTMLPMNVYISQMVGNEPMAGVTSAWVILLALGMTGEVVRGNRFGPFILIGFALGLALLSKATAILLIPIIGIWLAAWLWSQGSTTLRLIQSLAFFGVTAALIAGWYYARNYSEFKGKFIVGGWDPVRKFEWWQDPGYRTIPEFFRFGHSIVSPILAAFSGFWDALYSTMWTEGYLSGRTSYEVRPPWNEHFLVASSPLGLIPSALLILGLLAWLRNPLKPGRSPLLLSVACLLVYLAAMLQLYVQLPIYSTVKASYLLGITPCLAIIAMTGAQVVMKNRWSRAIVIGLVIGWAVNVYCTYFVVQTISAPPPAAVGQVNN